jgi:hypothetical protein
MSSKNICIFGAGGSARETYWIAKKCGYQIAALLDLHNGETYDQVPILSEDYFDPKKHVAVVAIGNSALRKKIAERLQTTYGDVFGCISRCFNRLQEIEEIS